VARGYLPFACFFEIAAVVCGHHVSRNKRNEGERDVTAHAMLPVQMVFTIPADSAAAAGTCGLWQRTACYHCAGRILNAPNDTG